MPVVFVHRSNDDNISLHIMNISANIATQPSRKASLDIMMESIINQFCAINIHHNTPSFDLADNGKFLHLKITKGNEIYFTLDDDIIYPPDYVATTLANLAKHPNSIITYHGRKLIGRDLPYYQAHKQYRFTSNQEIDIKIDVAGTGVTAFNTSIFSPLNITHHPDQRMVDLLFSLEAAKLKIPIICCARPSNWLRQINTQDQSILQSFANEDTPIQNNYATQIFNLNNVKINENN